MRRHTLVITALAAFPAVALADGTPFKDFKGLVLFVVGLINLAVPVVAGLALLAFFWGLVKFIYKSGDSGSHQEGRDLMIWGIVALFVMVSYLGLIGIAQSVFGINGTYSTGGGISLPLIRQTP